MSRIKAKFFTPLIALLLLWACDSGTGRMIRGVNELMESLKSEHLEDTRTTYWNLELHGNNGVYSVQGELVSQKAYETLDKALKENFPDVRNQVVLLTGIENTPLVNGLVNNSVIHLRSAPSSKTEMVTQALLGRPVRILKEDQGKSLIQIPEGYLGWVNIPEVHPLSEEDLAVYREATKIIFNAQVGTAYSDPDVNSLPVSDVVLGNILVLVGEENGFCQVRYPDGRLAWIRKEQCAPSEEVFYKETEPEELVRTALRFNGIPYLWGGTSSKAIDCSGLLSNIYFMNGIQLPRDADQMALIGKEITTDFESDLLETGDLLFFGRKAEGDSPERVTHVAMYMGDGNYIHSAGFRERVSINSMDSLSENFIEDYPEIFVRAVRILGEEADGFQPVFENPFFKEIIAQTE